MHWLPLGRNRQRDNQARPSCSIPARALLPAVVQVVHSGTSTLALYLLLFLAGAAQVVVQGGEQGRVGAWDLSHPRARTPPSGSMEGAHLLAQVLMERSECGVHERGPCRAVLPLALGGPLLPLMHACWWEQQAQL